jgi:RimJ/RimL family protein N-acetyltransferase
MTRLETPRLVLRRWRTDDLPAMAAVNADPEVMRWIADGSVADHERTAAGVAACERHWEEHAFGLFAVEVRGTGELAGFTGLAVPTFLPEIMPAVEIGWRLGREHWGQGFATEAARAALRFAFTDRGLDRIVSVHQIGNVASERVMRKLGMRVDRETAHPAYGLPLRVYAITRDEYERTAGATADGH